MSIKGVVTQAVVTAVVSSAIGWVIRPKPKIPNIPQQQFESAQGILVNKASNNESIPVVYGERQLGIQKVFVESSGSNNEFLYLAGVLCEGGIESIEDIYVNDKEVTWSGALTDQTVRTVSSSDANYYKDGQSLISVQSFYGLDNQPVSSILDESSNWGANHKLSGVAYVAFKFKWNQDAYSGGVPDIKVTLKGRKIYDPRLDSTKGGSGSHLQDNSTTWTYSDNPALALLDYIRNERFGKGLPTSAFETNYDSFKTAANTCETQVPTYSGGANIDLFTTNIVLDTNEKLIENVRELLNPMRGIFTYTQGVYKLLVEGTGSSVMTIDKDKIIGGIKIYGEKKNYKFNRVLGTFVNPDKNWQEDTVSFPPADDSGLDAADQYATMLAEDNGTNLEGNFDFKGITNPYTAEEMCEVLLRRSRNALGVDLQITSEGLNLSIGDIVELTYTTGGFSAKPFRIYGLSINTDSTVNLQLIEHQNSFYTWASKSAAPVIPDTTLPNPFSVTAPASVTLTDQLIAYNDGTVIVAMDIQIGASPDSFVDFYQVEYKKSNETDFKVHSSGKSLFQRVLNVIDQETYNVRVKAVNTLGVSSSFTSATRTIVGAIDPPSDVTDFSCNIIGQDAHLGWQQISDLDLAFYSIRYSTLTTGASWQNSVSLVEKVARPATTVTVPARVGSYLIKAVDKLGNFSANEAIISTTVTSIGNFNAVTTQTESPTFSGTKTNTVVLDNTLRLDSSELFDSALGNIDDATGFFDSGVTSADLFASGSYLFSSPVDIGAIATCRVTASITQTSDNLDDLFDSRTGDFDDASSNFDGDTPANCNAHIEIATSDDNVTYTAFRNFVIGNYRARFFKFKVVMTSSDLSSTPVISALSVSIDMEDRIFSGNDIVSGAGTFAVVFTTPFYSANYAVGITAQGLATGDFYLLTNKTVNGFNIAFKNSSGTGVSKTFDFLAKGF